MKPSSNQVLDVVEAIYRDEGTERDWIHGILEASTPVLDGGIGLLGFPFNATPSGLKVPWIRTAGVPRSVGAKTIMAMLASASNDEGVADLYRTRDCQTGSEAGFTTHPSWPMLTRKGVQDFLALNAVDTDGHGVLIGSLLPQVTTLSPQLRGRLARVAAHLGVGQRYRRLARHTRRKAVFSPSARLLHAEGDATAAAARSALARAVVAIETARGRQRRTDPDGALAAWKGLVSARWTLIDEFETDGKRFVVARENEPFRTPLGRLSKRERQVAGYVALGHTSKLIAYELGIADSTVRVLLARAMQRLDVPTREQLAAKVLGEQVVAADQRGHVR